MKYNNLQQIGKSVIIYKQLFYTNDGRKASMQKKRYHKVQGEKSQRLTAFLLATTLTIGTAPMALAAQQQDILNGTQISSLTETAYVNAYTNTERMMNFNDHWRVVWAGIVKRLQLTHLGNVQNACLFILMVFI